MRYAFFAFLLIAVVINLLEHLAGQRRPNKSVPPQARGPQRPPEVIFPAPEPAETVWAPPETVIVPSVDELSSEEEMSFTLDAASFQVTEGPAECSDAQQSDEEWSLVTMVSPSSLRQKRVNLRQLRQGIILSEILGPPRALRPWQFRK